MGWRGEGGGRKVGILLRGRGGVCVRNVRHFSKGGVESARGASCQGGGGRGEEEEREGGGGHGG